MPIADAVQALSELWPQFERQGIGPDEGSIMEAAAVGMVIDVWRNSPVEDMHASRRGPTDGEMFAESVALQRAAKSVLVSTSPFAIFSLEEHLLNRSRPWAGGGRTLQEMGYGHLGAFQKHVKERVYGLHSLSKDYGRQALLSFLITQAITYGRSHRGMPLWPTIVSEACAIVADPNHEGWRGKGAELLARAPVEMPSPNLLSQTLLDTPDKLPLPVLEWLIYAGPMMIAETLLAAKNAAEG
ncbi:hypothetical protein [Streptosporangium sp. NPDC000509]|uniref:hypothetical protein n=1 Tax=Streptosporangium sp. NPDC000509 TaxID=3366186 RepID=UPI0036B9508F